MMTAPTVSPSVTSSRGFWVHKLGRDAVNLHSIKYFDVYEATLVDITHRVYELMGVPESQDLL